MSMSHYDTCGPPTKRPRTSTDEGSGDGGEIVASLSNPLLLALEDVAAVERDAVAELCQQTNLFTGFAGDNMEQGTEKRIIIGKNGHVKKLVLSTRVSSIPKQIVQFQELARLDLSRCFNLKAIPVGTIGHLTKLQYLNLNTCVKLQGLPTDIGNLVKLKELRLARCRKITKLPNEIGKLTNLTLLNLRGSEIMKLDEIGKLCKLKRLDLSLCCNFTSVPPEMNQLGQLQYLNLSYCLQLKEFPPEVVEGFISLRQINLVCCRSLKKVPRELLQLPNLESMRLLHPSRCKARPKVVTAAMREEELALFNIQNYTSGEDRDNFRDHQFVLRDDGLLVKLSLNSWEEETLPSDIGQLTHIRCLRIASPANKLLSLPPDIGLLKNLRTLTISSDNFQELPRDALRLLSRLELLAVKSSQLRELPSSVDHLQKLKCLVLWGCKMLRQLSREIGRLTNLKYLYLFKCTELISLPRELCLLPNLIRLALVGCKRLIELPDELVKLTKLQNLQLHGCVSLQRLPENLLQRLNRLNRLDIRGCSRLSPSLSSREIGEHSYSLQDLLMDRWGTSSSDFKYYAKLNQAGRYLLRLEDPVPDAVWPLVFSKSKAQDLDVLYYFVRAKPELFARR